MKRLTIILVALVALPAPAQVTFERLKATSEPHNWLTYSGDYTGQRYSHLNQITRDNVWQLGMEWAFQTGATGNFQATPLVIDGIMYVTAQDNRLRSRCGTGVGYGATSGSCLKVNGANRGFAALGDNYSWRRLMLTSSRSIRRRAALWDVESEDRKKAASSPSHRSQ